MKQVLTPQIKFLAVHSTTSFIIKWKIVFYKDFTINENKGKIIKKKTAPQMTLLKARHLVKNCWMGSILNVLSSNYKSTLYKMTLAY